MIRLTSERGRLTIISGPVMSGKTEEIENLLNAARDSGFKRDHTIVAVKHVKDDVNNLNTIGSHEVSPVTTPDEIFKEIKNTTRTVIIAGVSHFEDKGIVDIIDGAARSGRHIITTALNLNADGNPPNYLPEIMALADEVMLKKAICSYTGCGNDNANRSVETDDGKFMPACSHHYKYADSPPISEDVSGSLDMIVGEMCSSKSDSLDKKLRRAQLVGLEVAVFKFKEDARYGEVETDEMYGYITLHDKVRKIKAININTAEDIKKYLAHHPKVRRVIGDEIQFIPGIYDLTKELIHKGYKLTYAGLPRGFNRKPFGEIPKLMCLADNIRINHGMCMVCHYESTESQRVKIIEGIEYPAHAKDPMKLIGGTDDYQPRCIRHWTLPGEDPKPKYEFLQL